MKKRSRSGTGAPAIRCLVPDPDERAAAGGWDLQPSLRRTGRCEISPRKV